MDIAASDEFRALVSSGLFGLDDEPRQPATAAVLTRRSRVAAPASRSRAAALRSRAASPRSRAASLALVATLLAFPGAPHAEEPPPASSGPSFDFSGTQRTRYESLDPQFRKGFDESDDVLALQTSLVFDLKFDVLQFYAEIMDSRAELNDEHSFVTNVVDTLEPIQTYVAWRHKGLFEDRADSTLRVGRMTIDLGKRRLVGRNRYRNTVNNFLGADWLWSDADGRSARLFYVLPMTIQPSDLDSQLDNDAELDHAARGTRLIGAYYQLPPLAGKSVIEAYLLGYDVDAPQSNPTAAAHWIAAGTRAYRAPKPGAWGYEIETIWQQGRAGGTVGGVAHRDLEQRAYFVHAEVSYGFHGAWQPTLLIQYDLASGDHDPNDLKIERFNPLFGARRFDFGPTGIYGVVARSNLSTPGLRLTLVPQPRWQTMFSYRVLQLAEARDQWVGSGWSDPTGQSGRSIGDQLEASFTWAAIEHRLSIETGFALLEYGRFGREVQGTALRGDPRYFYVAATTTF